MTHLTEKRWREVFLLTAGLLPNADRLLQLMKHQADHLLAEDPRLQDYLHWVRDKSNSVAVPYKPAAVRAFYLDNFSYARDLALARVLDIDIDIDLALAHALDLARARAFDIDLDRALTRVFDINLTTDPNLNCKLTNLKNQLPDRTNLSICKEWWKRNGTAWIEDLRQVMIQHRNIGHDWGFSKMQIAKLEEYSQANLLLVQCLNSDCYVSAAVRREIEETLLLPV